MISFISGKIITGNGTEIIVLTSGGVGYKLAVSLRAAKRWKVGEEAQILTYLVVREDALDLYGFENEAERSIFLRFLSVSGIGPKTALHLLSLGSVEEISSAIARGDVDYLTRVSGIGKKTAERIVVELKSKMSDDASIQLGAEGEKLGEIMDGLVSLGYSLAEAREAVKKLDVTGKTSEQLLKEALQRMR